MVPKGWSIESLGNVTNKVGSGVTPKGGSNSYKSLGVPLIRSQNVLWGRLDLSDVAYIDDKQHNKMKGSFVYKNDVLLNITGASIGRVAVSDIDEANVNQHVCIIRSEELNSEYLKSFLLSFQGQKQIEQCQAGGNRQGLNFEQIKSFKVPVPPLPEQQKIAKILSTWDKAISTTERLIENSTQQKKALMQQLLTGKKRLLDESGERFEGEWEEGVLGDLVDVTTGYAFKSTEFVENKNNSYSIVRMSDLKEGSLNLTQSARVSKSTVIGLERYKLVEGDFIFGMSGSLDNYATVRSGDLPCYLNQRVGKIRAKSNSNQDFVSYIYLSDRVRESILSKAAGAAQLNISIGDLRKTSIRYPNKAEQQKIATVLTNADKEIELLEQQLADLQQEKKALMQVLLTGKVRVRVDGEVA